MTCTWIGSANDKMYVEMISVILHCVTLCKGTILLAFGGTVLEGLLLSEFDGSQLRRCRIYEEKNYLVEA